ncbi:MAG: RNA pyrophosphohydrolase [Alphaproteobacteria bacterium]|nr:RNA pyrophosphohydrolase [Alphaproteobacteria bacterium]
MTGFDFHSLPYRYGVGVCLFNTQGHVLVAERRDKRGAWQMPQGGVQKGEDPRRAVFREMKEEIGTNHACLVGRVSDSLFYEFPDWLQNRRLEPGGRVFHGKYRGQRQDWFALKFLGCDQDIDLSGKNEPESPEFIAWRWAALQETPEMIVSFKRPVYDCVVKTFLPISEALARGEDVPELSF